MAHTGIAKEKILVTGITGIHGWPLFRYLRNNMPLENVWGIGPPGMKKPKGDGVTAGCITDRVMLDEVKKTFNPTIVIHAAGVCDLDVCEARPQWAEQINRQGTRLVAEVFGEEAKVVFLSTDLVFSGNEPPFGGYCEAHVPDPVSVAGKTFREAEKELESAVAESVIIRLGLPMGSSVTGDKGGLDWIEGRFRKNRPVTLFRDEYRSVLSTSDVARCVVECLQHNLSGCFHLGGPEKRSLHQLGEMILTGGGYRRSLLKVISRKEEQNGPPRIGDVSLNSGKIAAYLSFSPKGWCYGG